MKEMLFLQAFHKLGAFLLPVCQELVVSLQQKENKVNL